MSRERDGRCPHCASRKIRPKGRRLKKLEEVRLYRCSSCDRRFTPGPRALRHKTFPVGEILEALTDYNRGHSLEEVSRGLCRFFVELNGTTFTPLLLGVSKERQ